MSSSSAFMERRQVKAARGAMREQVRSLGRRQVQGSQQGGARTKKDKNRLARTCQTGTNE